MIYMEWLEALGAVACYKFPNPYIPLHLKLEQVMPRHTTSCHRYYLMPAILAIAFDSAYQLGKILFKVSTHDAAVCIPPRPSMTSSMDAHLT